MRMIHCGGNSRLAARGVAVGALLMLVAFSAPAQLDPTTNGPPIVKAPAQTEEQIRAECVQGRRMICGRVLQVSKEGLVVDSGYTALTKPPFDKTWVVRSNVSLKADAHLIEQTTPGAPCVGLVFLADLPKRPTPKKYDFVVLQGYPAGTYVYSPVPTVKKTIRKFTGGLATAVTLRMKDGK